MQYGIELYPYRRAGKVEKDKNTKKSLKMNYLLRMLICSVAAFLISRVILINSTAPFGIAFIIAILFYMEERMILYIGSSAILGYITLYGSINELGAYITVIITVMICRWLIYKIPRNKYLMLIFSLVFIELASYKFFIIKAPFGIAFYYALFETICIFPIYFIINYSIICFNDIKTKHLFNNEELISMSITASLVVSGMWGISVVGITFRNIFALVLILSISYINGSAIGSAAGVAMGVIIGMSSKNMTSYISIYGLCGLIPGIFKETGKWFSGAAYIVSSLILIFCSNVGNEFKLLEAVISCGIFYIIPNKYYLRLALELDSDKKEEVIKHDYIGKIKGILMERLKDFSGILYNMSDILNNMVNNDKLSMKNTSSGLVENLADRVCSSCNINSMCWKRELHYTYAAFSEMIENFQEGKDCIPKTLEKKCIRKSILLKQTEQIVDNYIINEMWRKKLRECRELLSSQIGNMAGSLEEIMNEFNSDIKFNNEIDKRVRRILERNEVDIEDSICIQGKNDRPVIKITMKACSGRQICVKQVLPLINEAIGKNMCISDEGCKIDASSNLCTITFEEMPQFYVSTYVVRQCKDGEKYNGDSYYFGKLNDGTYMNIISDGMGSGPQAGQESKAVVDLIEKFTSCGFNKKTAINTANSIITLKFSEDEKFSTVDLASIDLYSGEVEFMKVGAVASFIKSGSKVYTINSKTLPIGVLDKADIDLSKRQIKNGDVIVMVSDGILDYNNENGGNPEWIKNYLESCENCNPQVIADGLMEKAKELSMGRIKDDMTLLVSKAFSLY